MLNPRVQAIVDSRRAEAVGRLQDAFAQDSIDVTELEERLELVEGAQTVTDLDLATRDLPVVRRSESTALAPVDHSEVVFGVLSGATRRGRFVVPESMYAAAFWGSVTLDFTKADFGVGFCELNCRALMGGITVIVPENVRVECRGSGIMGGFQERVREPEELDAPILRVTGIAFWGGVIVRNVDWRGELLALRQHVRTLSRSHRSRRRGRRGRHHR